MLRNGKETVALSLLLAMLCAVLLAPRTVVAQRLALLIGNDAYPDTPLQSCVKDAQAVARLLRAMGYAEQDVSVKTNVSKTEMLHALTVLLEKTKREPAEQVVLFFSGHGTTIEDDDNDEGDSDKSDEAFLCIDDPTKATGAEDLLVRDDAFFRITYELSKHTRELIIVLDTCHSGGLLRAGEPAESITRKSIPEWKLARQLADRGIRLKGLRPEIPKAISATPVEARFHPEAQVIFLAACEQNEEAAAGVELSEFTRAFIDLVERAHQRGEPLALDSLLRQLRDRLAYFEQTPMMVRQRVAENALLVPEILPSRQLVVLQSAPAELSLDVQEPYLRINSPGHLGQIRSILFTPDGQRICSAGFDKVLRVWKGQAEPGAHDPFAWVKDRDVLWEAGQGLRGSIYALAVVPDTGQVAMAGYGNRGHVGEIWVADPLTGRITDTEYKGGHAQPVAALAFSADGRWLASHAIDGQVLVRQISGGERTELAPRSEPILTLAPITIIGSEYVAYPVATGEERGVTKWQLQLHDLQRQRPGPLLERVHWGAVTALAGSQDGRFLASADQAGSLNLWDLHREPLSAEVLRKDDPQQSVVSLAFDAKSQKLACGSYHGAITGWDLSTRRSRQLSRGEAPVWGLALSPDGRLVAASQGNDVLVLPWSAPQQAVRLPGGDPVDDVYFADGYDVHFRRGSGRHAFQPDGLKLSHDVAASPAAGSSSGWEITQDRAAGQLELSYNRRLYSRIPFDVRRHGLLTTHAWTKDRQGRAKSLLIGTEAGTSCLFQFDLVTGELQRHFVGHYDRVNSIDVSSDQRYAATGSSDGTLRYWPLGSDQEEDALLRRWGIELAEEKGQLVVRRISDVGPLFFKGMREGDAVEKILWPNDANPSRPSEANQPDEIARLLRDLPWHTQVVFITSREGQRLDPFQEVSGWHEVLAVYPSATDWIAWNPLGYYACSAGGERLVGWQVSQNLGQPPRFFPAVQFYKSLYQPELIRGLLKHGTVRTSLATQPRQVPTIGSVVELLPPHVRIVSHTEQRIEVNDDPVTIVAEATPSDETQEIQQLTLYINDIPRPDYKPVVARVGRTQRATWELTELPFGSYEVRIIADTNSGLAESDSRDVVHKPEQAKPALYLLAIGVSDYPQRIGALEFAHRDAFSIHEVLASGFPTNVQTPLKDFYSGGFAGHRILQDEKATKQAIQEGFQWLTSSMGPNDVGVFFFSGHGESRVVGHQTEFFLLPSDVDPDQVPETSLSQAEIKEHCLEAKGTLILILDACHSGASGIDLLTRDLGRRNMISWTSCQEHQQSLEHPDWRNGAFTYAITEVLRGSVPANDYNRDRRLSTGEIEISVSYQVERITGNRQTPQFVNLPTLRVPLANVPEFSAATGGP